MGRVCKEWLKLSRMNSVWEQHLRRDFKLKDCEIAKIVKQDMLLAYKTRYREYIGTVPHSNFISIHNCCNSTTEIV
jgi:hypothetical protein